MKAKLIKEKDGRFHLWLNIGTKDADHIASNEPLVGEWGRDLLKYKLSLKNCQAIERGYDLDELVEENFKTTSFGTTNKWVAYETFRKGFQKALELMGDKKFTEKDVKMAITNFYLEDKLLTNKNLNNAIQSIQQNGWEVNYNPKEFDADGCLILKRVTN